MITFEHVTKRYTSNVGVEDVNIHINKGDFVFLVGPSGAGKSTFIKLIMKEIEADEGSIKVMGKEIVGLPARKLPEHRRNIGMIFQDFRLLPNKTVYENVAFAMEIVHKSPRQIRKQVPRALSLMGISSKADMFPDELSAGEQQRVAIARAIINKPSMLIADEPTGNLDPATAWEIMTLLEEINKRGTTIVMVTHAKDIVDRMKKRVVAIESGKIVRDTVGEYSFEETVIEETVSEEKPVEITEPEVETVTESVSESETEAATADETEEVIVSEDVKEGGEEHA